MINYTERLTQLIQDIVERIPTLSFIDIRELLVFARYGRSRAQGAYATCHCLNLPESEPGYYFWRERATGKLTRRSDWFVTKSPIVQIGQRPINYLISFALPRFCDQVLEGSRKAMFYDGMPDWVAKLDTVVHELYHIDPAQPGIRRIGTSDSSAARWHGPMFLADVAAMVKQYLASKPDPFVFGFLALDFKALEQQFEGIVGTTFRTYPSFPQRYLDPLPVQPPEPEALVVPVKSPTVPTRYTEDDLCIRQFLEHTSHRLVQKGRHRAA
ncbi:MAG: hypothetical protein ACRD1T_08045 [Acidimicrobiia bacterium]